jgi:hypothetical protein
MATRGMRNWPYTKTDPQDLPSAELALLDAARAWEQARRRDEPTRPGVQIILAAEGAASATPALDGMLQAMAIDRPLRLGCTLCPRLTVDESLVLLAVASAQRGARREALGLLLAGLPRFHAFAALAAAIPLGCHFRMAGLRFSDPWAVRPIAQSRRTTSA